MTEVIDKEIKLGNKKHSVKFRKLSRDEIISNFLADLVVQEIYDQSEYVPRVVRWCFPEFSGEDNVSYENVVRLYSEAIKEIPDLKYENMFKFISKGLEGKIDQMIDFDDDDDFEEYFSDIEDISDAETSKVKTDYDSLSDIISNLDFKEIDSKLKSKVIGQEKTIDEILDWMLLLKYNTSLDKDSVTNLYLMGPSGVGKTTFVRTLANDILNLPLLIVPGAQYSQEHAIRDLIGAPKSYIGYDPEGGVLSKFIKKNPVSFVLFDEAEKMHKDIYDNLVNFMDTGLIAAPSGQEYKFNGCAFFTSNLGNRPGSLSQGRSIGFGSEKLQSNSEYDMEKDRVMSIVKQSFPREIIGRINDFVLFDFLGRDSVETILNGYIARTIDSFKNVETLIEESARQEILNRGYSKESGVRELQKTYERTVFMPILRSLEFNPDYKDCKRVHIGFDGNEFTYKPYKTVSKK